MLVRLDRIGEDLLEEVVTSAWLAVAPKKLADELAATDDTTSGPPAPGSS